MSTYMEEKNPEISLQNTPNIVDFTVKNRKSYPGGAVEF